jgi:hypothetical protein
MILTAHQPNYLPYLGFVHKAARADMFMVVDTVQFVKRGPFGWIHRNRILGPNGVQWLTVPVITKGRFGQTIRDVEIRNDLPWRRKHWRAIEVAYRGAPHFARYAPALLDVYEREWTHLAPLAVCLIRLLFEWFHIDIPVRIASEEGIAARRTDLIIAMCRHVGADTYLSGIHGRDYLDEAAVAAAGIRLVYQQFSHPVYPQGREPFVPNLSAIDLLFRCGPDSRRILEG